MCFHGKVALWRLHPVGGSEGREGIPGAVEASKPPGGRDRRVVKWFKLDVVP